MKNNLINFIYQEKINETGIVKSGYTWLDLATKFNIKPQGTSRQRSKAANDIWRRFKKSNVYDGIKIEKEYKSPFLKGSDFDLEIEEEWFPKIPTKGDGIYIIMGCVHVPFANLEFMKAVLKCIQTLDVTGLIFNGDFLDLNTLSFYDKGKIPVNGITLGYEYDQGNRMLDVIESVLPDDIYKCFIYGNHEDRFKRHMKSVDFAKLKGAVKDPTEALKLVDRGYEVFENWSTDELVLGDLTIIHGEFCGVHTAKAHLDTYKKNMLFAHTHRSQMYREGEHVSYNIGSMANFKSPAFNYATKSMKKKWSNGFAIATVVNGKTTVEQINWNEDHFVYGGNIWKV